MIDFTTTSASGGTDRLISWEEIADQARIDNADEQELVERMIDAATDYAEEAMGCTLVARNRTMTFRDGEPMRLRWGPTLSIVSVVDGNDAAFTDYELRRTGKLELVHPNSSITYPVTVTYQAGYESAADVPSAILQAIRMHAATLYKVRESVMDKQMISVPQSVEDFYRLKSWRIGIA